MAKQISQIPNYVGVEHQYLKYVRTLHTFLSDCGWVNTGTSITSLGLDIFNRPVASSNVLSWGSSGTPVTPEKAFDGSTSTMAVDTTAQTPTSLIPFDIIYDFGTVGGTDVTHVIDNYKIYFDNVTGDPGEWTFSVSDDAVSWTTADTQTGQVATGGVAGYVDYEITATSAVRYFRFRFTANQGSGTNFRLKEIQAYNGSTLLTGIVSANLLNPWKNQNMAPYWEDWTPGDSLQTSHPFSVRIWFGATTSSYNSWQYGGLQIPTLQYQITRPGVYNSTTSTYTVGYWSEITGSDSYYGLAGSNQSTSRWIMRGDSSSFAIAGLADVNVQRYISERSINARFVFGLERLRNTSGDYIGDGMNIIANNGSFASMVVPDYGIYQGYETVYPCLANTTSTTTGLLADSDGTQKVYLMHQTPFYRFSQPPMLNFANYYSTDLTPDIPFLAEVYGGSHTYYPIGQGWFQMVRGTPTAGLSCAVRWDD